MRAFQLKRKKSLGQGMTEYIIIVALIAIAAVGVYNLFGKTVRNQMSGIANGLAGDDSRATNAVKNAKQSANDADGQVDKVHNLSDFANGTGKL